MPFVKFVVRRVATAELSRQSPTPRFTRPPTGAVFSRIGPRSPVKYIAFDLETTGVNPGTDRITEFSFLELDENLAELGRWSRLVDPTIPIPMEVQELTGITQAMVAGQPTFASHAPRIQALVHEATLIAHNAEFDLGFLNAELRRAGQVGIPADHPAIDTLAIERHFVNNKLATVYKRYTGQEVEGAHRSEADVRATVEVLRHQRTVHKDALPANLEQLTVPAIELHFGGPKAVRIWLDHDRRLYRDAEGIIVFGFGPYKGCPAIRSHACRVGAYDNHEAFLLWMKAKDFSPETKATIDMVLKAKAASGPTSATSAPRPASPMPSPANTAAASQARLLQ